MKIAAKCYTILSLSYKEHVKVFNPFPSKKLNEYMILKGKKTYSQRHCLKIMDPVSHPLFERFMRSLSGTRPFNMRYSSEELRFNRYMSCG